MIENLHHHPPPPHPKAKKNIWENDKFSAMNKKKVILKSHKHAMPSIPSVQQLNFVKFKKKNSSSYFHRSKFKFQLPKKFIDSRVNNLN